MAPSRSFPFFFCVASFSNSVDFSSDAVFSCTDTSYCYDITTVGIVESTFENLPNIYPNPTSGQLTVKFNQAYDQLTITVKSIDGRFISSTVIKDKEKVILDIEGAKGYYLINIESLEGQHAILKILKQ